MTTIEFESHGFKAVAGFREEDVEGAMKRLARVEDAQVAVARCEGACEWFDRSDGVGHGGEDANRDHAVNVLFDARLAAHRELELAEANLDRYWAKHGVGRDYMRLKAAA